MKLTRDECDHIRQMYADRTRNIQPRNLAHLFRVSSATILKVLDGKYRPREEYKTYQSKENTSGRDDMKITYQEVAGTDLRKFRVKLDGKHVGTIKHTNRGWEYFPKGKRTGGAVFETLVACKASLEDTEPRYLGPTANEVLTGSKVLTGSEVLADVLEFLADAKPTYENTYWNSKGKHEGKREAVQKLVPTSGEVPNPNLNPALEQFRKASNCYYDLYNNGLWNRANEYREVFGIDAFDRAADDMDQDNLERLELTQELIDHTEGVMDEIILAAYAEQFPPTPTGRTIDITPVGCQTPEGNARVVKAQNEWDDTAAELANMAIKFFESWGPSLRSLIRSHWAAEDMGVISDMNQIGELIANRKHAQEAFLRAVAGAPEATESTRCQKCNQPMKIDPRAESAVCPNCLEASHGAASRDPDDNSPLKLTYMPVVGRGTFRDWE